MSTAGCFGGGIADMRGTSDTLAALTFSNLAFSDALCAHPISVRRPVVKGFAI